ncbi:MAG: tRNA 2-thiocytidine(32) synthetase TtcA [Clostridiaceae bacterium]|jgi:tRNA(Ile)-lysidine synthase TilS/MesJ|nr:tRNA 2-thiocytidine(32) synthetase TtcA [Clostridiaceae bacterium]
MINDGDKIAVGVSGGKDSQLLLIALNELRRFLPQKFDLVAVTIDLGFEKFDRESLLRFYNNIGVDYHIEKTNISQVVFDVRNEQNPCALCSNMKRGAFYNAAIKLGCNKAAFAHHMDDVIETFLMCQIYEGRIHTFSPITYLNRKNVTLIRPMIYAEERLISTIVGELKLEPVGSGCPSDGITKRQNIKELIKDLARENPHLKSNLFGAIQRAEICGWKPQRKVSKGNNFGL